MGLVIRTLIYKIGLMIADVEKPIKLWRKDKARTCHAICKYIERKKQTSKTEISRQLKRPYSCISEAADSLVNAGILKVEGNLSSLERPGRPTKLYRIIDSDWQESIYERTSWPFDKLSKLRGLVTDLLVRLRKTVYETEEVFQWGTPRSWPERKSRLDFMALRDICYAICYAFSDYHAKTSRKEYYISPTVLTRLDSVIEYLLYQKKIEKSRKPTKRQIEFLEKMQVYHA